MQEQNARLLSAHVLVNGNDVDAFLAHGLEHGLKLALGHREVAVNDWDTLSADEKKLFTRQAEVFGAYVVSKSANGLKPGTPISAATVAKATQAAP